jgi:hypothetical protein
MVLDQDNFEHVFEALGRLRALARGATERGRLDAQWLPSEQTSTCRQIW